MSNQFSIRVFNETGITEFERIVSDIKNGIQNDITHELLTSEDYTELLQPIINIEQVDFKNKIELIPYIANKLNLKENKYLYFNTGLWTWLSAFYFENICPTDGNGKRKVNEAAFYILREPKNYTKFYRHLLAYPSRIFSELDDSSKIFLVGNFTKRGEVTEQFGAYQEIALNKSIIDAANILYWDSTSQNLKRGAASKSGGSARRLIRIIRQYQMTYDLNSMKGNEIVSILPTEFNKWLPLTN